MQNGWIHHGQIQEGGIQDGCHHQVEWEWKIEVFFLGKMDESNMAEFKLAAIIELS